MVFKSLSNDLALQYMRNIFTQKPACSSNSLWNTKTGLRLPKKNQQMGKNAFLSGVLNYGIASVLGLRQHPPELVLRINIGLKIFFYTVNITQL